VLTSLIAQLPLSLLITIKTEKELFWLGGGGILPKAPFFSSSKEEKRGKSISNR
jgi:hypothetical protein